MTYVLISEAVPEPDSGIKRHDLPSLAIDYQDLNVMRAFMACASPYEVNGFGLIDEPAENCYQIRAGSIFIADQVVTGVTADVTPLGWLAAERRVEDEDNEDAFRLQWHSHGLSDAYHSGRDLGTAHDYGLATAYPYMIWVVGNCLGKVVARIEHYRPERIGIPMHVYLHVPDTAPHDEINGLFNQHVTIDDEANRAFEEARSQA